MNRVALMLLSTAIIAQTAGAGARTLGTSQGQTAASGISEHQTAQALEEFKKLLQEESDLLETVVKNLEKQVQLGTIQSDGPEITSAKQAFLELQQRMAAFDAGTVLLPATFIAVDQGHGQAIASARNEGHASEARQRYRKLLEKEIEVVKAQNGALDKKFEAGAIDRYGPEVISARRELLELQQRLALFDVGILLSPATPTKR